jgi:hypothetical protein
MVYVVNTACTATEVTTPLFALTEVGKELVIERAKEIETPVLINTMPLPGLPAQKQPI